MTKIITKLTDDDKRALVDYFSDHPEEWNAFQSTALTAVCSSVHEKAFQQLLKEEREKKAKKENNK